jgi:hypothetical protein
MTKTMPVDSETVVNRVNQGEKRAHRRWKMGCEKMGVVEK